MWGLYFCFGKVKLATLHNNKKVMVGHIVAMRNKSEIAHLNFTTLRSNGVVFPAGHLLHPIPRLNPTPGEDIDQLRHQGRALASSTILHVRADHSSCQGAFSRDSKMLCSLERLVSPSVP